MKHQVATLPLCILRASSVQDELATEAAASNAFMGKGTERPILRFSFFRTGFISGHKGAAWPSSQPFELSPREIVL